MSEVTNPAPADVDWQPLTAEMLESLRRTKPWVRFLSIVGFVSSALMVVAALVVGGLGMGQMRRGPMDGYPLAALAVLYFIFAIAYVLLSRFLHLYAGAIHEALATQWKADAVERALEFQRSFWRFAGIFTIVMLLAYLVILVGAIAIPTLFQAIARAK